jgi:hypothetical protein
VNRNSLRLRREPVRDRRLAPRALALFYAERLMIGDGQVVQEFKVAFLCGGKDR